MNEPDQQLRTLHNIYMLTTGHQPPFSLCERRWFEWAKHFAEDDLKLTLDYVMRVNKKRERQYWIPTRFGSIIGDLERFADLCGEARADKRAREHKAKFSYAPDKASVLRATGRPDTKALPEPQHAKQIMEGILRKGLEDSLKEAEESMRFKP